MTSGKSEYYYPITEIGNIYFFSFFLFPFLFIPVYFFKSKRTMKKEFFYVMVYITWNLLSYSSNYIVPAQ